MDFLIESPTLSAKIIKQKNFYEEKLFMMED